MKVVILAGGMGTRLSEETVVRPKPMIEIGGRPVLWHIMKIYSHFGFNDFIICLGYKGYVIKEYFANYFLHMSDVTFHLADNRMDVHRKTAEPWHVTLIDTGADTQTGGRIKRIMPYVQDEPFFALTYGDGVANIDLKAQVDFHKLHGRHATVTAVRPAKRFGAVQVDADRVVSFEEKPDSDGGWINGGFFLLSPSVDKLIAGDQTVWEREPMEALARSGQLSAFVHRGFWHPMDTLRDRNFLEQQWDRGTAQWRVLVISPAFWQGRRILLTGHTGFKGAWTALLLESLGAEVHGLALAPTGDRDMFSVTGLKADIHHALGDIRDPDTVRKVFEKARPQIVLHMAAQSLVRPSYADPVATYATNVLGTVHVLECARHSPGLQAIVVVTSDKCYENTGQPGGYREGDPLGGYDPYSNSKACVELVIAAFRRSFFSRASGPLIASARAGNVIGGGDWAVDRLVPDAMRTFGSGAVLGIRNPHAVRPWQHVLDPVIAYLLLAERLSTKGADFAEAWNFGPGVESEVPVSTIADMLVQGWGNGARWLKLNGDHPHEAPLLKLDCTKARTRLGWRPLLGLNQAIKMTVNWYKAMQRGADMRALSLEQIAAVLKPASVADRVA